MRVQKQKNIKKKFTKSKNISSNTNLPLNFDKNCIPKQYNKINKEYQKEKKYLDAQAKEYIDGISNIQKIYEPTTSNNLQKNKINKNNYQSRNKVQNSNYISNYKTSNFPYNENIPRIKTNVPSSSKNIFSPSRISNIKNPEEKSNYFPKNIITNETNKYFGIRNASSEKRRKKPRTELFYDLNNDNNDYDSDFYKKSELPYKCDSPNHYKFQSYVDERKIKGIDDDLNEIEYDNYYASNINYNKNERLSRSRNSNIELSQDNDYIDYNNERQNIKNDIENSRSIGVPNNLYNDYCFNKMIPEKKKKLYNNYNQNKHNLYYNYEGIKNYNNDLEIGRKNILNPISRSFFGSNMSSSYQKKRNIYYTNNEADLNNRRSVQGHFPNYSPKIVMAHHHSMIEDNIQLSPMKNYIDSNADYNNRSASKKNNKIRIIRNCDNQIKQFDINLSEEGEKRIIPTSNNNYYDNYYGKEVIPLINNQFNINSNKKVIINKNKGRSKNGGHSVQKRNINKSTNIKEKNPNKAVYYEKNSPIINNNDDMANKVFVKKLIKNELPNQLNYNKCKKNSMSNSNIIDNENKTNLITVSNETKETNDNIQKEIVIEKIIEKHTFTTMSPCKSNSFELLTILKPNEKINLNDSNDVKKSESTNDNSEKLIFNNENEVIDYVYTKFDEERKKKSYFNRKLKFTGFILIKKIKGKDIFNIRIEDDIKKLNNQLKEENVTVENQLIEIKFLRDKEEKINENNIDQTKKSLENNSNANINNKKEIEDKLLQENSQLKKENEMWVKKDVLKNDLINKLDKEKVNLLEEIKKLSKEIEVQKIINNKLIFNKNDNQLFDKKKLKENKGEFLEIFCNKKRGLENKEIENIQKDKKLKNNKKEKNEEKIETNQIQENETREN